MQRGTGVWAPPQSGELGFSRQGIPEWQCTGVFSCRPRTRLAIQRRAVRGITRIIGVLACAWLCAACGYRVTRDPNVLVRSIVADPGSLNPLLITDAYGSIVASFVYESLLTQDNSTLVWKSLLAEAWNEAPDHLTYTYHLRRDVRWHDGVPLTAADVVYTFNTINDPASASPLRFLFAEAGIAHADALDDYTVRFRLTTPYFLAFEILSGFAILPQHVFAGDVPLAKHPATRAPIGTGPYRFAAWDAGRAIRLARNPDYWKTPPALTGMTFKVIPDIETNFLTLKRGEIDLSGLTELQWHRQAQTPKFLARYVTGTYLGQSFSYNYLGYNLRKPLLADRRVRQALTMLVPRQEMIDAIYFGNGVVANGPFHPRSPQADATIQPWPYDPAQAAHVLDAAGWSDRDGDGVREREGMALRLSLLISGSSRLIDALANILRENYRRAGIDLSVRRLEWSVFLKTTREGDFDIYAGAWASGYNSEQYQLWHSSQIADGSNYIGYSHPDVDRWLVQARTTFDDTARNALYHRVHQQLHNDQPYTFLFVRPSIVARHHRFTDATLYPEAGYDPLEWHVGASEELLQ